MSTAAGKRNLIDISAGKLPGEPVAVTLTQVAAPAGGAGATAGAYDTAANRDLAIVSINAARDDIIAIKAALAEYDIVV